MELAKKSGYGQRIERHRVKTLPRIAKESDRMNQPTTAKILATRKAAGLTQAEAGALIYRNRRTWQDWEYGVTAMDAALYELFRHKTCLEPAPTLCDQKRKP
jgi:DNA-binding transcriptional regulator YiaG